LIETITAIVAVFRRPQVKYAFLDPVEKLVCFVLVEKSASARTG
jgi:hypothetical protein